MRRVARNASDKESETAARAHTQVDPVAGRDQRADGHRSHPPRLSCRPALWQNQARDERGGEGRTDGRTEGVRETE